MIKVNLSILLLIFVTTISFSQRRYVEKQTGFSVGLGGSFLEGERKVSSQVFNLTAGFVKQSEINMSVGSLKRGHHSTTYISAGIDAFTYNRISPIVSFNYSKYFNKEYFPKHAVSLLGGVSIIALKKSKFIVGCELGAGASFVMDDRVKSNFEKSLMFGLFSGLQPSENFFIMLGPSASVSKGNWLGSLNVATLIF